MQVMSSKHAVQYDVIQTRRTFLLLKSNILVNSVVLFISQYSNKLKNLHLYLRRFNYVFKISEGRLNCFAQRMHEFIGLA